MEVASRLLEVDPYDEAVNAAAVRTVRARVGDSGALHEVNRLARPWEAELGVVPPSIQAFRHELGHVN